MDSSVVSDTCDPRRSIAAAAVQLFVRQGYDATTVDQIARKAGSSRATVFRYFGCKEEILFHRYDLALNELRTLIRAERGSDSQRIRRVLVAFARRLEAEGQAFRVELELIARNPRLFARALVTLHVSADALARELTVGGDPLTELRARVLAHSGIAALQAAVCLWLSAGPDIRLADVTDDALRLTLQNGRGGEPPA